MYYILLMDGFQSRASTISDSFGEIEEDGPFCGNAKASVDANSNDSDLQQKVLVIAV